MYFITKINKIGDEEVKNLKFDISWITLVLVLILIRAILEQSINNKMVSKILVGMSTTDMYLH